MPNSISTYQPLSRRSFLKATATCALGAATAGGVATLGSSLAATEAEAAAEERVAYTYHNEHCLCNCMLKCTVRDGNLVMIEPRANDDYRFQNICMKGISELQNIYGEARIQYPMKRTGERGSGQFERISWDEAFAMIAENLQRVIDKYGPESLWIQYSTEASQRFTPLLASILGAQAGGANGYDLGQGNGQAQAFGWSGLFALNTMWGWPEAKTVILANCNVLETGMMWSRGMLEAQEAGTRFICLDPRFSVTASKADQWVNLTAGTDPALFLTMTNYILENGLYDEEHILTHTALPSLINIQTGEIFGQVSEVVDEVTGATSQTKMPYVWDAATNGLRLVTDEGVASVLEGTFTVDGVEYTTQFSRLREEMAAYPLAWGEKVTGVPADVIAQLAEEYAEGPSIICNGVGGIDKFYNNDVAGHCYALIASITGNYGKRGTGCGIYCYHVTPYEAHLGAWALPEGMAPAPSPMGFYDVVHKSKDIHGALFFGDIPTQKSANWNVTLEWLDSLDFVALADIYKSSVMDFVDLVLPVCSKFECSDEVGGIKCANAHILQNQKILEPLFEAKSDFYVEKGIAEAMGVGQYYPADGDEFARALLATDDPQMAGFTLEKLTEANGALKLLGAEDMIGPEVGFVYGTPSTKQEPYYENMLQFGQAFPAWEQPNEAYAENPLREKYPLTFLQARTRFRVHSAYGGSSWIQELYEPHIELNPVDAEARGLVDGDKVEVFNDRGSFLVTLRINNSVKPDCAFMAESTYRQYLDGTLMQSVCNDTLNERGYAMMFGPMIPFNDTLVEIRKAGE
ncbi:MAG: molybdopterin-dependent oxidoreductase [Eggerthellaceae bacterium]|nr:molybdopterin-dependent oxidoreductase [Eggerthellaceae bacterium]